MTEVNVVSSRAIFAITFEVGSCGRELIVQKVRDVVAGHERMKRYVQQLSVMLLDTREQTIAQHIQSRRDLGE